MWLKHQTKLQVLQISNTYIMDLFPEWFGDISSSLLYVNISHNKLSGVLPKSLSNIETGLLSTWDFSFNNLSGPLPPLPPRVYELFLSNNMFSGFVSCFCETSPVFVTYLDLSSNSLTGPLPNCWQKFRSLEMLNLANNSLSGRVPESFGKLQNIVSMHLNNNKFSGEIPSLTLCKRSLRFIDFGDNILEGTLQTWLDFDNLIVLRLRGNRIRGSIPTSLCNMLSLQVLDLSSNNITGEIPQCIGHLSALSLSDTTFPRGDIYGTSAPLVFHDSGIGFFVEEIRLTLKGFNMVFHGKILIFIKTIDISNNNLKGEIPQSITSLVALFKLNLSRNSLTGFIPDNIGDMRNLESLDLSRNHLYGRVTTSFINLSFLECLDLSFNNLSGKIPEGSQLSTFDSSSYVGNIGLCGPPLTDRCPRDERKRESKSKSFEFYISFGLGFCVGFSGVCGTLTLKSSWRRAYFQFFISITDWTYVTVVVFTARMKRLQIQD